MPHPLRTVAVLGALLAVALTAPATTAHATSTRPTSASADVEPVPLGAGSGIYQRVQFTNGQLTAFYVCTLTAIGHDAEGNLVALSNAHCFIDDKGNKLVGDKVYVDPTPPGSATSPAPLTFDPSTLKIGPIGEVTYVSTPNNYLSGGPKGLDYAVIKLDPSKVTPTPTITSPSGSATVTSIGDVPPAGTRMCKQGHRTGLTCGATLGPDGPWYWTLIWTDGGDSGSPVVNGTALVGVAWGAQHFTPITSILSDLNSHGGVGSGFHVG